MRILGTELNTRNEPCYVLRINDNQMRHLLAVISNARRYTPRIPETTQLHCSLRNLMSEIGHAIDAEKAKAAG